jgi:hypothetical protein
MSFTLVVIIKLNFQESLDGYVAFGYLYALAGSGYWLDAASQCSLRWESSSPLLPRGYPDDSGNGDPRWGSCVVMIRKTKTVLVYYCS